MAGSPGRSVWSTVAKLIAALIACGVLTAGLLMPYVGGVGLFAGHEASKFLDTPCKLTQTPPPLKTTLYASDGKTPIATLFTQDRQPIPLSGVPQFLQDALIATEDRRFYQHHGVDMRGLLRSLVSTSGGATQGGSTLTMQYVKQERYYQAGSDVAKQQAAIAQNINRKIEDAKCAIDLERQESKAQILDNYLNIAFFGENSYGIQTAAETYFDKKAIDLTLPESALLVGLLRAPSAYDPFLHPQAAKERRDEVLQNMVSVSKLTQAQADQLKRTPVSLATTSPPLVKQGCANSTSTIKNVAFFCDYAVQWLENVNGIKESDLQTGGLKIVTTLNANLQNTMQTAISQHLSAKSKMTAVMPAIDPRTGDVLAMASSKMYGSGKGETEQPIFTSYIAQGASTYKLFPLLAALSTGVPSDWPLQTAGSSGTYKTLNCSTNSTTTNADANEFYSSNETLATATAKSSNTYFVGLVDHLFQCYLSPVVSIAQKLGMNGLQNPGYGTNQPWSKEIISQQLAKLFVLGDIPTSPLEIAGAYAGVANNGSFNAPSPIRSIMKPVTNGTTVTYQQVPVLRPPAVQAVAPQVAQEAVSILGGDTHYPGTSASAFSSGWYSQGLGPVSGKTGTMVAVDSRGNETNKNAAVWFVGMTPTLTAATAVINFDSPNSPNTLPGEPTGGAYGDYASRLWIEALSPAHALGSQTWTWSTYVPGNQVPDISGHQPDDAKRMLAAAGFKFTLIDPSDPVLCPSTQPYGTVGYYAPTIAQPGSTITVCLSSGVGQPVFIPPPPKPSPTGHPSSTPSSTPSSSPPTRHRHGG